MPSITFGNALQNYFLSRFRRHSAARKKRIDALKSCADAEKYVLSVRNKIKRSLTLPSEKCPLEPQITDRVSFPGFVMEKVLFKSRPGVTVSGNVYLPENPGDAPLPAVLFLCGHAPGGKNSSMYQSFCRSLAMRGFAVLIVDPIGQGERRCLSREIGPTQQHNIMGKQLHLTGDDLFSWRIFDAIRSMDYLLSRSDVDPARVAISGESGGGTLTTWMAAVEDRAFAFVPSSVVTTWLLNVSNEVAVDIEQIPPGAAARGIDLGDFLIAAAPKPMLLLGGKKDFFDPRGFVEINEELKKIYALLGHPERLDSMLGEDYHGIYQPLREKGYEFLCNIAGLPNPCKEEGKIPLNTEEELAASPGGSVYNLPGEKRIYELAAEKAELLRKKRRKLSREELKKALKKLLYVRDVTPPVYRKLAYRYYALDGDHQNYSRFGLETEQGEVMCILFRLAKKVLFYGFEEVQGKTTLYIPHADSASELQLREPAAEDALYSIDTRGVGECTSTACDQMSEDDIYFYYGINYHFPSLHLLWGEDMCGKRLEDILSAISLIAPRSASGKISLEAKGHGCIYALLAAVFSPEVSELTLEDMPSSWEEMVKVPFPSHASSPLAILPRNILSVTDIPEIVKALEESGLPVTVK